MRTIYTQLFSIEVHHGYYATGSPGSDVTVVPSAETSRLLRDQAFVCRPVDAGVAVYAEVTSTDSPPQLRRPTPAEGLRFAFLVRTHTPYLVNVTELPDRRLSRQLFCFDNLREDIRDGDLHLGDSIDGSRLGPPVWLESGGVLRYALDPPTTNTHVECHDRFGAEMFRIEVASPDPAAPLTEARIDEWDRLRPGRYTVSDDGGGSVDLFKPRTPQVGSVLGMIEIFDRTDGFAADGVDRVPPRYRFLTGRTVTPVTYRLQLEPRTTTWRYVIINKFQPDELEVSDIEIESDAASFTFSRQIEDDRAIFTADTPRALTQKAPTLRLKGRYNTGTQRTLLNLPGPMASHPLEAGANGTGFLSPMYVYV